VDLTRLDTDLSPGPQIGWLPDHKRLA